MKRYPKKYYASTAPSLVFSGERSVLWNNFLSSNTLSTADIAACIHQQVYLHYSSHTSFVHGFLVWYDTVSALCSGDKFSFSSICAAFSDTYKHLQSLGLLDKNALCLSVGDMTYRFGVKKMLTYLYEAGYLVQQKVSYFWDFVSGVSVSDHDVTMVPRPCMIHRVRCFIDSKKESVLIHITQPHLLFAAVAIAVHPSDRRYRKMVGKKIIIPIINRIVPIVADESIDVDLYNGIKLITPCHDRDSLLVAQRHHLPIDVFATDGYGIFTHHAAVYQGKPYTEFSDNIIQYLQDIHNYDGVETHIVDVPFCAKTNRYLWSFLADGWVVTPDVCTQKMIDFVWSDAFVAWSQEKAQFASLLENLPPITVSSSHGVLGIGYTSVMRDTFSVIDAYYTEKKLSEDVIASMIIYDMIYDKILPWSFVMEQCIDALFASWITKDKLLWQEYCDFLMIAYKDNKKYTKQITVLSDLFERMMKGDTDAMHTFADMLDTCPILEQHKNHYILSWALTIHFHAHMSDVLIDATYALYMRTMQYWDGSIYYLSTMNPRDIEKFVLVFMLHEAMATPQPSISLVSVGSQGEVKWSFVKQCIEPLRRYSLDTMRLSLITHNLTDIASQELIIQKIWNVCRYVYMHVIASWMVSDVSWNEILSSIQDDQNQLTPFDQWILYRFMEISTKLAEPHDIMFPLEQRLWLLHSCIIDDFAIKYIEATKQRKWPLSHRIMLLCVGMICDMVSPIMPSLVWGVRQLFGVSLPRAINPTVIRMPSKNYKIHLLMMIVWCLRKLKTTLLIKNHQQVDICIQWSTDIAWFIQEHRSLLDAIVGVHTLSFLSSDQDIDASYLQEYVVDIALWLKMHAVEPSDVDRLTIMHKEKSEYLQHLRALISTWSYPEKEMKLEKLKEELQDIEYQLLKAKQS
jgi:hypothetical protein